MKKLKIFDAVEEVMNMDDLQLIQARKHFKWTYLRSAFRVKKLELLMMNPTSLLYR